MKKILLLVPAIVLVILATTRVISILRHDEEPVVVHDIWNTPISREVKAVLIESFGPDALDIVVGVDRNVAVLSGDVSERATRELAERVAESVDGILVVHNFIDLSHGDATETLHERTERDKALRARVSRELNAEVAISACDGVVLLQGVMPDRERHDAAIRIAESLTGVRKVIDRLRVTWTSSVSVASLTFGAESMTPYGKEK